MSICAPHRLQAPCLAVPTLPEALVPSDSSLQGLLVPQSQAQWQAVAPPSSFVP